MSIKIDNIDKRILFELEKNARIQDVKLAKIIGKSKDAVRYRIKKLEEDGIIEKWKTWIDVAKLGYKTATIYLTLLNIPEERDKLLESIRKDKRVYWLGIAEGVWNVGVTYFVKSNEELFEIKSELLSKYQELIIDCHVTSLVNLSVHEKIFLVKQKSSLVTFTESSENIILDDMGKNALRELYFNSRENIASIASKYNTSVDIIRKRIKNLEEQKIIVRYTIQINYQKIGYELYKSFIYLKSFDEESINSILKYAEQSDKIINIVKQIAPWDIEFIIFANNFQDYNSTVSAFTKHFSNSIKKVETAVMSEDIIFPCDKLILD